MTFWPGRYYPCYVEGDRPASASDNSMVIPKQPLLLYSANRGADVISHDPAPLPRPANEVYLPGLQGNELPLVCE